MGLLNRDELEKADWDKLYQIRLANRGNPEMQRLIAPYEHQAYAREQVADNPMTAPVWALMPAGYQAYKMLGLGNNDDMSTPPSLAQATAGLNGVAQGLLGRFMK